MTAIDTQIPAPSLNIRRLFRNEPVFAGAALLLALLMIPTGLALGLDTRSYLDENVWIKPLKFQAALAIYLLTLAYFARWLPAGMTDRRTYRVFAWAVVGAILAETAWISLSAANGIGSHFNISTPFMAAIYGLMGVLATLLTSASTVYGVAIWRNRRTGLTPGMQSGIALGLILTLPLTLLVAGYMAQNGSHLVGAALSDVRVPVMGWSRVVGDLRVSHFFATHALHLVPLAMLVLPQTRRMAWLVAGVVMLLVLATFAQALAGHPFLPV